MIVEVVNVKKGAVNHERKLNTNPNHYFGPIEIFANRFANR